MKIYCKNKNWKLNEEYNSDKILYFLIDRPNYHDNCTSFAWLDKIGQYHRNYDLPAVIHNSYISWYKNYKSTTIRTIWFDGKI